MDKRESAENRARERIEKNMRYKSHQVPKNCCGNCLQSIVTNPGAQIPGLSCKAMKIFHKSYFMDSTMGNSQVHEESICDLFSRRGVLD